MGWLGCMSHIIKLVIIPIGCRYLKPHVKMIGTSKVDHTFSSQILTQLRSAGFTVHKCATEKEWQLMDKGSILLRSRSLGDLTKKSVKEFSLDWK
jgi:hypothetical protein